MQVKIAIVQLSVLAVWLGLSTTLRGQQAEPLTQIDLLNLINAQNVLSVLVVIIVLGAGRWFNTKGWPWLMGYLEIKQEHDWELKQEQSALTREAFQVISNVSFVLGEVKSLLAELKEFSASYMEEHAGNDKKTKR